MALNKTSAGQPDAAEPRTGGAPTERREDTDSPQTPGPGVPIEPDALASQQREPPSLIPTTQGAQTRKDAGKQFRPSAPPGEAAGQLGGRSEQSPEAPEHARPEGAVSTPMAPDHSSSDGRR